MHIPAALYSIVNMQNLLLHIFSGILDINSLKRDNNLSHAFSKNGTLKKKYSIDKASKNLIEEYWNTNGKYIRCVRNINDHHDALIDQTFFELKSDPGQILIFFPDNPECRSPEKFTYKKEINAVDVIEKNLIAINKLVDKIGENKGLQRQQHKINIPLKHVGDLAEEQERTLSLLINIARIDKIPEGEQVQLKTFEIMQVIPNREKGKGNIGIRELKTDKEAASDD